MARRSAPPDKRCASWHRASDGGGGRKRHTFHQLLHANGDIGAGPRSRLSRCPARVRGSSCPALLRRQGVPWLAKGLNFAQYHLIEIPRRSTTDDNQNSRNERQTSDGRKHPPAPPGVQGAARTRL